MACGSGSGRFERFTALTFPWMPIYTLFTPQLEDAAAVRTEGNVLHALATGSGN